MRLATKVYEVFKDDEAKARALAELFDEIEVAINSNDAATSHDLYKAELTLVKEIEQNRANFSIEIEKVRGEIKETELRLKKEIDLLRAELKVEIEKVRGEIKETELRLKKEIDQVKADLTKEIEQVRADLSREIEQVRADLSKEIEQVRADLSKEIEQVRFDLTLAIHSNNVSAIRWLVGLMFAQLLAVSGLIVGLFQYFLK